MIITGLVVLAFLGLHFYDFWVHEMKVKYGGGDMSGLINPNDLDSGYRYHGELVAKFVDPVRVIIYVISFVLLSLHLMHGFQSSFQSSFHRVSNRGSNPLSNQWELAKVKTLSKNSETYSQLLFQLYSFLLQFIIIYNINIDYEHT